MKKKLSMLAAMALCVTVGGVYATWMYATQAVTPASATMSIALTGTSTGDQAGTLKIEGKNVALTIDDPKGGEIHKAELQYDENGYFLITFTPNTNAEGTVKESGVGLKWNIGLYHYTANDGQGSAIDASGFKFKMKDGNDGDVFTKFDTSVTTIPVGQMTKSGEIFTYQLKMTEVMPKIELNNNLYLTTMQQYSAFETLLSSKMIHVHVEAVMPTTNA